MAQTPAAGLAESCDGFTAWCWQCSAFFVSYKILFLDVLFPLDVKKIIFVDADQVGANTTTFLNTLDDGGSGDDSGDDDHDDGDDGHFKSVVCLLSMLKAMLKEQSSWRDSK